MEVQIIADRTGKNPVHFGTRNCSIQSTGLQKRIEIAPGFAPNTIQYTFDAEKVMRDIIEHSLALARKVNYDSVGTWEWIVTKDGNPFLMEVNTRIQVENGVSAAISRINGKGGVDLIAEQIRTGLGEPLGYTQQDITFDGVGIEYRLIAEDTDNNFTPWVGDIDTFTYEKAPWLSLHTHLPKISKENPYTIPTEFDPNLALGIIWGTDLENAKQRGKEFLNNLTISGSNAQGESLKSNIPFLLKNTDRILKF